MAGKTNEKMRKHDARVTIRDEKKEEKNKQQEEVNLGKKIKSALWFSPDSMMAINVDFIEWFDSYYEFRLQQMECLSLSSLHSQVLNKHNYWSIP